MTKTFEEVQVEYEKALKASTKACQKANVLQVLRDEFCPHTNTSNQSRYHEGGYLNTDYTEYWTECDYCGAKSEVVTKNHGNYS